MSWPNEPKAPAHPEIEGVKKSEVFTFSPKRDIGDTRTRREAGSKSGGGRGDDDDVPKKIPLSRFRALKKEYPDEFPLLMRGLRAVHHGYHFLADIVISRLPAVGVPTSVILAAIESIALVADALLLSIPMMFSKRTQAAFKATVQDALDYWHTKFMARLESSLVPIDKPETKH